MSDAHHCLTCNCRIFDPERFKAIGCEKCGGRISRRGLGDSSIVADDGSIVAADTPRPTEPTPSTPFEEFIGQVAKLRTASDFIHSCNGGGRDLRINSTAEDGT
jgi:hypothetical protein